MRVLRLISAVVWRISSHVNPVFFARKPDARRASVFKCVVIVGSVPLSIVPRSTFASGVLNDTPVGPVNVRSLIALAAVMPDVPRPCLVLTSCALHVDGLISVFGYSDRKEQIAVVSLHSLSDYAGASSLETRVQNESAHELGHLNGLGHCSGSCVMKPVHSAAELDTRPIKPCGQCPQRGPIETLRKMLAFALIVVAMTAGNEILSRVFPFDETPFTCWAVDGCGRQSFDAAGPHDEVSIYFEGHKLITLFDKGGGRSLRDRSLPAIGSLNKNMRSAHRAAISVCHEQDGGYAIGVAGHRALLHVLPKDIREGENAQAVATNWATTLNHSMRHYAHTN